MEYKTSLVTGGAGFIGSHVADHLLKMGHRVVVFDDLSGGFKKNIPTKSIFIRGSINNQKLLDKLFNKYQFDYVYHLAAYAAEGLSHYIRRFNYENNLIGSINLINLSIKYNIKHFVFTSSIAVYGTNQLPMHEDLFPQPEDPYGIAKLAVEQDLKAANKVFGLTYTIFRPHNVYGERQNLSDPYRNVVGIFIKNILADKPMTIYGNGKQKRAFSYISDVAPYISECTDITKAKNSIFNIGAETPYSVLTLAHIIAKAFNIQPKIEFLPPRKEVKHAYSDHKKVKKVFKINSTITLEEGLKKMVLWVKQNVPNTTKKFKDIEIYKKIPTNWRL
ncbi:UDP-glucose 4-epimerase [Candidatus Roizmanbacteria bacterium RIFCSPLOWO2_01_FULL_38_12]|uniref:UDP-glucose 4-epimerase n=1 Tax=Candidatus Roizmanbacteria bacterium RIFCSPLOWO2_01_FULL_38_12 TaxID=1802061 RepID=A0A1F7IVB1_9BACT|nr:MAG: UDP-glucose 4-epimerase [Candidatus Roizmanbacteria bacterium RIFCSPHIGHO2_12_FULL_38_13]OGK47285.1 MAG: UDP-glucose 4-epimerase [Candidatus Roizmanbacteria bacterium RIFCSPLOWO2_01_FULL_38_12]